MKTKLVYKSFFLGLMLLGQGSLAAQNIHYTTLHGDCEDVQSNPNECHEQPRCCHYNNRYQTDQFAEEQFEDASWPSSQESLRFAR